MVGFARARQAPSLKSFTSFVVRPATAMPVLALSAALLMAQSAVQVDLEISEESDFFASAVFSPAGDVAYLGRLAPGVITRYQRRDG